MTAVTYYHRYNLENMQYWGSTRKHGDDPTCGYTEVEPPVVDDHYTQIQVWNGTEWIIQDRQENIMPGQRGGMKKKKKKGAKKGSKRG